MDKSVPQPQYGLQCFDKVISPERITTHISLSSYRNILNGWDQVTICWDDLHQSWEVVRKVWREAGSFFLFCHYLLITTYVVASFLLSSVKDWDISHILYFPPWSYIMISNLGSVLLLTTMVVRSSKSLLPMLSLSDWKASCGDDDERSLQHPWPPPPFYKYACTL